MNWKAWLSVGAAGVAVPAAAADWWWIGINGSPPARVVTYVDLQSVSPLKGGAVHAVSLAIGERALPNGQQHQATEYAIKCKARSFATLGRVGYDSDGKPLALAPMAPTDFEQARPGSIGGSIVDLVCGRPSGMEVRVAEPLSHALAYLAGQGPAAQAQAASPSPQQAPDESRMSIGTGFFVGPGGDVLTSYHVIDGAERIGCRTPDGKLLAAKLVRGSRANDLALLKVAVRPSAYLGFAPPASIHPGDRVFTIGYGAPNYLGVNEPRFTDGTISALSGLGAEDAYMQISVPVQPGNSGGPLVNEGGQVVGVIAAQAAVDEFVKIEGAPPQNINWAVKSDYASPLLAGQAPPARRSREEAIRVARDSLCLIFAE
jgi:S1-C subfamily serine protease